MHLSAGDDHMVGMVWLAKSGDTSTVSTDQAMKSFSRQTDVMCLEKRHHAINKASVGSARFWSRRWRLPERGALPLLHISCHGLPVRAALCDYSVERSCSVTAFTSIRCLLKRLGAPLGDYFTLCDAAGGLFSFPMCVPWAIWPAALSSL